MGKKKILIPKGLTFLVLEDTLTMREAVVNQLKKMGFSVDHHIQDNLGHGIDKFGLKFGNDFLKKIFKV